MEQNYDIHKAIPQLRFPGFQNDGEWSFVHGNELFDPIVNKNHNSDLPVLAITQDQGAVPRDMIDYKVIVSDKSIAGYKVVEIGDFIISLRSFQGGIEYSHYKGLCSPAYIVLRKKDERVCNDFYRYYFKSSRFIQDLNRNIEGIRDGKMISYQQFSDILIPFPSFDEQLCIAESLSSLDEMLSATNGKLEQLKAYKKGLMQKLFPAQGKTLPEFRFKEFENDGEWAVKKLGEVVNVLDSQRKPVAKEERVRGKYPYYGANGIQDYVSDYVFDGSFILMGEDGSVINKDGTPVLHWAEGQIWVNNHAHVLSENSNAAYLKYVYYILSIVDVQSLVKGIPPKINQQNMRNILLLIPSLPEQEKIATCLSRIDEKINAYKEKLALLGQYKKGLMQQVFPT